MPRALRPWWVALVLLTAATAAPPTYPLLYRFNAGDDWEYETRTTIDGRFELRSPAQPPRTLPVRLDIGERTRYAVSVVKDDGSAWLAISLQRLEVIAPAEPERNLLLVARGAGGRLVRGEREWLTDDLAELIGAPDETLLPGLTAHQALDLLAPAKLRLSSAGRVVEVDRPMWSERLGQVALIGSQTPLLSPFGRTLPELPGKAVPAGQEWFQRREVALPGGSERYELPVTWLLAAHQQLGQRAVVRLDFKATARLEEVPFTFTGLPDLALPLTLRELTHVLDGRTAFDPLAGQVVEEQLTSEVTARSEALTTPPLRLEATIKVGATRRLLAPEVEPVTAAVPTPDAPAPAQ